MFRLIPRVQHYDWGSYDALPRLTGRAPGDRPEAELWFGAHESAPSGVPAAGGHTDLAVLYQANPKALVGADAVRVFDGRFPFMLKVLAPTKSLSIQCHPSREQAQDATDGTYVDTWPKPEGLVAITPFETFVGMRDYADIVSLVAGLEVPELSAIVEWASGQDEPSVALLEALLTLDLPVRNALVRSVIGAIADREDDPAFPAIRRVAEDFPGDIGLVVLLTMNHLTAMPGDYVFVPAGCLHAYQHGVAVEIMANSDNVIRAGLTPKAINIPELLRIVRPDSAPIRRSEPPGRVRDYGVDTDYFHLYAVGPGPEATLIPGAGPRIVLSLQDSTTVTSGPTSLELSSGDAAFLAPGEDVTVAGSGTLFVATAG
ncbi:mannose-6-phosphate isomerase type 1 [Branchiibius hedensis]|uniref:mannose-6-phosphate isomerase n=1 Tax=Branchiibius hedensis TaxID=672460 RepID=A0A2Y8ZTU2_9MICO|nr:mannose-6-phosphate isomerase, class I [Branchiibius hedensis]PWJ26602.1 mannose-6-phosphate isomerase type 1 [Branchiibius hedensis]SSA35414.1 mannose-6-phosphate isomerase, type 1 [Branchiibius hedensis]